MIFFPNAKINIGLNIIKKRTDGFHHIESVFYPVGLCDALEVIENKKGNDEQLIFTSSGIPIPGKENDNLCYAAFQLINNDYPMPKVKVHLHKNIPIGAGLGGGSADAAFFIRLLNDKFNLNISHSDMNRYAGQLGSDCSFFIENKPVFVEGKGDEFEPLNLDLSNHFIAIIYPNIHINTAKAYAGVEPKPSERSLKNDILTLAIDKWKDFVHNDFEDSLFLQHPILKNHKDDLYDLGALYAAMSGSGSSIYGIFNQQTNLKEQFKDCFVWEGNL